MPDPATEAKAVVDARADKAALHARFKDTAAALLEKMAPPQDPNVVQDAPERAPATVEEPKPPAAKEEEKKTPERDEQGRFVKEQKEKQEENDRNWKNVRETLDRQKGEIARKDAEVKSLRADLEEIRKSIPPKPGATDGMTPADKAEYEKNQQWAERFIKPLIDPLTQRLDKIEKPAPPQDADAATDEDKALLKEEFAWYVKLKNYSPEAIELARKILIEDPSVTEGARNWREAFERTDPKVQAKLAEAAKKASDEAAKREAEKRGATGRMGRSLPAPETTRDQWDKQYREAMARGDRKTAESLRVMRFRRDIVSGFDLAPKAPQE